MKTAGLTIALDWMRRGQFLFAFVAWVRRERILRTLIHVGAIR
jgi:hypothetical protein